MAGRFLALLRGLSRPGCLRATAFGLALVALRFVGAPRSSWAAVPKEVEPLTAPADPAGAEVEAVLGPGWEGGGVLEGQVAQAIVEESRAAGLDPILVMAVIRVESRADAWAVSPKGARGLMQVRPPTLRYVAAREGWGTDAGEAALRDPVLNVRLGIRYLHRLRRAFGDLGLALAAYHLGPTRVAAWRKGLPLPDAGRAYPLLVRRVYRKLLSDLGEDPALLEIGFPPSAALAVR